jgi:hypothetical protein
METVMINTSFLKWFSKEASENFKISENFFIERFVINSRFCEKYLSFVGI